ncbi:MAG TPA: N-acetylmuramoyl-L-alanine amidase [Pyrinomonadaceae bacterium]|nr:N-acetylmuramoyl-L-alanine amidase [Pyrinomonadaceae bacterium]
MAFKLTWLPDVLKNAGLKVSPVAGWETRGLGNVGDIFGIICHHTGVRNPNKLNMPTLKSLRDGRKAEPGLAALPGPLAQLGLGRDGTYYIIAAGRAAHAGKGSYKGVSGNLRFIGIEAENFGNQAVDPWPAIQLEAYQRGVAAILKFLGKDSSFCCGHKEYAPGRKSDPNLNMNDFRAAVDGFMAGAEPAHDLIPPVEPAPPTTGSTPRKTIRRPMKSDLVKELQKKLKLDADGTFGPKTEAAVRQFQRDHNLTPDGIVGPRTWAALDA